MGIVKYEKSQRAEFEKLVSENYDSLCIRENTALDEGYRGVFTRFQVGFASFNYGKMNGFIIGRIEDQEPYLDLVCAKEGTSGVAKDLAYRMEEWFRNTGKYKEIHLEAVSDTHIKHYRKWGYKCTSTGHNRFCMKKKINPSNNENLENMMSNLNINRNTSSGTSSRLPNGCAELRNYSKYIDSLDDYSAADLKAFVKKCSLAEGSATTKADAIKLIKAAIRKYKSQYNL